MHWLYASINKQIKRIPKPTSHFSIQEKLEFLKTLLNGNKKKERLTITLTPCWGRARISKDLSTVVNLYLDALATFTLNSHKLT